MDQTHLVPPRETGEASSASSSLMGRVAEGDVQAFETLYEALSSHVYGLILRILRDAAQAEEVCQEVFTEAWRQAPRFDPDRGSARSWILTMAHRRAVDRVRSEQAASDRAATVGRMEMGSTPVDEVVDQVSDQMEREKVRRCLARLTEPQRLSVHLTYFVGHTQREAAELLGVPLTTIKGRLRDGLIRLRDCLGVSA